MKAKWFYILLGLGLMLGVGSSAKDRQDKDRNRYADLEKTIAFENIEELRVEIEIGVAELMVKRAQGNHLLEAEIHYKISRGEPRIEFDRSGGTGYLTIKSPDTDDEGNHFRGIKSSEEHWELRFSSKVPITFSMELGLVDGTLDMSGLKVADLAVSSGLSDLEMLFNEPNPIELEELKIECGLGDFNAYDLGNANFQRLRVEGGLGSVFIDLSGDWRRHDAEMKVEVGLGSAKIKLPPGLGVEINAEDNFLSSIDLDRDLRKLRKGTHRSENWETAQHRLIIDVELGLGSLKVDRDKE